jgi:hypothetical protein
VKAPLEQRLVFHELREGRARPQLPHHVPRRAESGVAVGDGAGDHLARLSSSVRGSNPPAPARWLLFDERMSGALLHRARRSRPWSVSAAPTMATISGSPRYTHRQPRREALARNGTTTGSCSEGDPRRSDTCACCWRSPRSSCSRGTLFQTPAGRTCPWIRIRVCAPEVSKRFGERRAYDVVTSFPLSGYECHRATSRAFSATPRRPPSPSPP